MSSVTSSRWAVRWARVIGLSWLMLGCARAGTAPAAEVTTSSSVAAAEATQLLEQGRYFYASGDWTRSEQYLSAAIEAGASVDDALPALVKSCIRAGRYRAAAEHAEDNLHELRRQRADLELILATLYLSLEEPKRAVELLDAVLAQRPADPNAHFLLGETLRDSFQDFEQADGHFRKYLELAPTGRYSPLAKEGLLRRVQPQESSSALTTRPVRIQVGEPPAALPPADDESDARATATVLEKPATP